MMLTYNPQLPSAIVGDLDSIKPHIKQHYQNCGVPIIHNPDQYSTDFTKCVDYLRSNASKIIASSSPSPSPSPSQPPQTHLDILIFGGLGGRVDQAFSQIHHLYTSSLQETNNNGDLFLISEESISFVLRRGRNTIRTTTTTSTDTDTDTTTNGNNTSYLEENIGILPVGVSSVISTEGLEWDVKDWKTEIGGMVSTSNHIRAEVIAVETTVPVLFTAELARRFKIGGSG